MYPLDMIDSDFTIPEFPRKYQFFEFNKFIKFKQGCFLLNSGRLHEIPARFLIFRALRMLCC